MKKNIVVLAALMLGAASLSAEEAAAPTGPSLSATSTLAYDSTYVFRGIQLAESILSPAVSLAYGDFYGGLWFALPMNNEEYFANEMDANFGYGYALNDMFKLDVGVTRYTYNEIPGDFFTDPTNSTEFYAGIVLGVPLSPAVYVYRDIDYDVTTLEARAAYSIELTKAASIALSASVGYVIPDDGDEYTYYGGAANLVFATTEKSSLSVGARFGGSSEDYIYGSAIDPDESEAAVWFGGSFSVSL
jgi:uncharacterized protein (TIGR02001 family)